MGLVRIELILREPNTDKVRSALEKHDLTKATVSSIMYEIPLCGAATRAAPSGCLNLTGATVVSITAQEEFLGRFTEQVERCLEAEGLDVDGFSHRVSHPQLQNRRDYLRWLSSEWKSS